MTRLHKLFQCSLIVLAGLLMIASTALARHHLPPASVCFGDFCFYPQIAKTQAEKEKGLMGQGELAQNGGMLFVYNREYARSFWMKGMLIPLDFIWMDAHGKVVHVHERVPSCGAGVCPALESKSSVQYVLEVASGRVHDLKIKVGDQAIIKLGEKNAD